MILYKSGIAIFLIRKVLIACNLFNHRWINFLSQKLLKMIIDVETTFVLNNWLMEAKLWWEISIFLDNKLQQIGFFDPFVAKDNFYVDNISD